MTTNYEKVESANVTTTTLDAKKLLADFLDYDGTKLTEILDWDLLYNSQITHGKSNSDEGALRKVLRKEYQMGHDFTEFPIPLCPASNSTG